MKCSKTCKEIVHFVSPEMSATFDHAIVNMPDGSEKYFNITQPKKWRVKGNTFGATPIAAYQPIIEYTEEVKDGITVKMPHYVMPEIIYGSRYTGIDKRDQYFKDIRKIERFVKSLNQGEKNE